MDLLTLFLIAVGLSMDAFAVSVSDGMCYPGMPKSRAIAIAGAFGLFQGIMPVAGYFAGSAFADLISGFDHWIALILLAVIGGNMIREAIQDIRNPEEQVCRVFTWKLLLAQAMATSIDALAVGISFAMLSANIYWAAGFIAVVTFTLSLIGVVAGKRFGGLLRQKAEIAGGIILILIGLKIFIEHTFF